MLEEPTYEKLEKRIQELEKVESHWRRTIEKLKHEKKIYRLLIDTSSQQIKTPTNSTSIAIQTSLNEIGEFVGADRAYIFKYNFEKNIGFNTYEWCGKGIESQIQNLQESPIDAFPEWINSHHNGKPFSINAVAKLPLNSMRDILEQQKIKSLLSVPMFENEELVGFVGFDSVREPHIYSDNEIEIIKNFIKIIIILNRRKEKTDDILLSLPKQINFKDDNFTLSEIKIVKLLQKGKRSKDISQLLNISKRTVETHRMNIRKKLNLTNKNINLSSYLISIK